MVWADTGWSGTWEQRPAHTALRLHMGSAHGTPTHYVQPLGARGNPSGPEYCITTENTPAPPAPSPTTPPLAKMPGSWCCSPISDSSAAPLKSVRTACGQRRGQAAFCTLDQPSQQQPQSRGLCAQANTMPLPVNFSPLGSFSLTNLKRLGGAGSQTHSRKSL